MENKVTSQLYLWFWGILLKLHTLHSIIYVIHLKNLPYKTNNLYTTRTPSKETALISLIAKKILTFPSASLISELSCLFSRVGDETSSSLTQGRERLPKLEPEPCLEWRPLDPLPWIIFYGGLLTAGLVGSLPVSWREVPTWCNNYDLLS